MLRYAGVLGADACCSVVQCDDHIGSSARRVVPGPGGASTTQRGGTVMDGDEFPSRLNIPIRQSDNKRLSGMEASLL